MISPPPLLKIIHILSYSAPLSGNVYLSEMSLDLACGNGIDYARLLT